MDAGPLLEPFAATLRQAAMERACRPSCGLQAGAASGEDEDRLLQGCEPAWRLSYNLIRLSGLSVSRPEDDVEWKGRSWLHARSRSKSVDGHQPDRSALVASSSQRQIPAGAGREVQPVHSSDEKLCRRSICLGNSTPQASSSASINCIAAKGESPAS